MSWAASAISLGAGIGSSILGSRSAKKAARRQAALAREQANKLRARAAEESLASKREIETMRTMRALDLPAFRQASETAMLQARKGAERMQRQRMMGRLAPDVRSAIFGGEFQQYVGREMQRLGQYAGLTQQILQATERQQQYALSMEQQAASIELGGQMQAIQTEAAAGDPAGNILGAVGQAASQFASAKLSKAEAAGKTKADWQKLAVSQPEGFGKQFLDAGGKFNQGSFDTFYDTMMKSQPAGIDPFWSGWFSGE